MSTGSTVARTGDALWRRVGGEVLLAAPEGSDVDRLSVPASAAWVLLERPMSLPELTAAMAVEFGVEADEIRGRVEELVSALEARGWLVRADHDE